MSAGAQQRWVAATQQVSSRVEGETVILHMGSSTYFGLDHVGTHVWEQLDEPRTLSELRDAVVARFDVTPDQAERDLIRLLADLEREGLVGAVAS
jgi:hypothetical protein